MDLSQVVTVGVALVGSIGGAFLGVKVAQARLEEKVSRLENEIGDRDHGMRKQLHDHAGMLGQHELRIGLLEKGK